MGAISGGGKLEAYLRDVAKKVSKPATLKVGFFPGSVYPDGTPVATVAAINNYGAPSRGIPPRPFFSDAVKRYRGTWGPALGKLLKASDMDATLSLDLLGQEIQGEIEEQILETNAPPLSPVTLMIRKLKADRGLTQESTPFSLVLEARALVKAGQSAGGVNSKPLEDTDRMVRSVRSTVTPS